DGHRDRCQTPRPRPQPRPAYRTAAAASAAFRAVRPRWHRTARSRKCPRTDRAYRQDGLRPPIIQRGWLAGPYSATSLILPARHWRLPAHGGKPMSAQADTSRSYAKLTPGDPAPWFHQRATSNPNYAFDTAAGRYVVLCFYASAGDAVGRAAIQSVLANR